MEGGYGREKDNEEVGAGDVNWEDYEHAECYLARDLSVAVCGISHLGKLLNVRGTQSLEITLCFDNRHLQRLARDVHTV